MESDGNSMNSGGKSIYKEEAACNFTNRFYSFSYKIEP